MRLSFCHGLSTLQTQNLTHNPMSINRGLYSLEKLTSQKVSLRETQEIL